MKALVVYTDEGLLKTSGGASVIAEISNTLLDFGEVSAVLPELTRSEIEVTLPKFNRVYEFRRGLLPLDFSLSFFRQVRRAIAVEKPDIVVTSFLWGFFALRLLVQGRSRLVYFSLILEQRFRPLTVPRRKRNLEGWFVGIREGLVCDKCDHIISVSPLDKRELCSAFDISVSKVTVVQPGNRQMFQSPVVSKTQARRSLGLPTDVPLILFNANMRHSPNRDAVDRILHHIAPRVGQLIPAAKFVIAGPGNPTFSRDNIISISDVESLPYLLDSADVAVMPINVGGGIRVKMMDYMSRGVPVISTPEAMEGIDYSNGREVIIASTDEDFASELAMLLQDPERAKSIGDRAFSYAKEHFSPKATHSAIAQMMHALGVEIREPDGNQPGES